MQTASTPIIASIGSPSSLGPLSIRVGSIVNANVIRVHKDALALQIGKHQLTARVMNSSGAQWHPEAHQLPVKASFRVLQISPQLILKPLMATTPPSPPSTASYVRASLPSQQPLNQVLHLIAKASESPMSGHDTGKIHQNTQESVRIANEITQRLPSIATLSTALGVETALKHSGVFYESELARRLFGKLTAPKEDLKWRFLQAATELGSLLQFDNAAPSTFDPLRRMSGYVDAALARIETMQLASLETSDENKTVLIFEIPFKDDHSVKLIQGYIERHHQQSRELSSNETSIVLEIPFSATATLLAKLTHDSRGLKIVLWSENTDVQHALRTKHENLIRKLGEQHIEIMHINIRPLVFDPEDSLHHFEHLIDDEV